MKIFLTVLIAFLSTALAGAQISDATYLNKLSKSLRGVPATQDEREQLRSADPEKRAAFWNLVIGKYMKTEKFEAKLKRHIDELVRVRSENVLPSNRKGENFGLRYRMGAYDFLVRQLIQDNVSWDQLITGKSYRFYEPVQRSTFGNQTADSQFFESVNQQLPKALTLEEEFLRGLDLNPPADVLREYHFDPNDPRIAGILTTPRFLNRYVNTALNKNRRRAAALFRILLCDPMVAAIPARDSAGDSRDLDLVFPAEPQPGQSEAQLRSELPLQDPHGSQPDCRACHDKLDPVGQVFAYSSFDLNFKSSPGALSYRNKNGEHIFIPVQGIGDLAQKITEQPDYVRCQVQHFWRWYIGEDVPMTFQRENELIALFNEQGRKPQNFIRELLQTPEFKKKPRVLNEDQLLARHATKIMKNCNSCHQQKEVPEFADWDLTSLPYGKTLKDRQYAVDTLKDVLDIANNGKRKEMPPKSSVWKLSADDFKVLKDWLNRGAPDYEGVLQVPAEAL